MTIKADAIVQLELALSISLPELEGVSKNKENPAFKQGGRTSKYADLGAVIDAIRPIAAHGIWYRQVLHEGEHGVSIETLYTGFGATISAGTLFMPADKANAQGYGSALTYARRYALQTAFGLSTEDDDGNAASASARADPKQGKSDEGMPADAWAKLAQLAEASGTQSGELIKRFGVKNLRLLTPKQYDEAIELMASRLAEKAKEETNKTGFGEILDDEIPGFN